MALPPSWTALSSLRALLLDGPGLLDAASALHPLGSWTQLTLLRIHCYETYGKRSNLEQQLTRLSALQDLCIRDMDDFELPPGRWQGQLTSLECDLQHVLPAGGSPTSAAAVLAHATALRRLWAWCEESTQPQLRALLGTLAALPVLELLELPIRLEGEVREAHTALGSPLGGRLQFSV